MKVLVTGAGGYIGGHLCKILQTAFDLLPVHSPRNDNAAFQCDLSVEDSIDRFSDLEPDAILHCAAIVPSLKGQADSEDNAELTRRMDDNVIKFCMKKSIPIIYFSTCGLYDAQDPAVKHEASSLYVDTPYKRAKRKGELLLQSQPKAYTLRISSPFMSGALPSNILRLFCNQAKSGTIKIWGKGLREQDFTSVQDIAAWVSSALAGQMTAGIYNAVSGLPVTMHTLARHIANQNPGTTIEFIDRAEDMNYARYDNSRIVSASGHVPSSMLDVFTC